MGEASSVVGGRRFPWDQEGGLKSGCSMFEEEVGGWSTPVLKSEQAGRAGDWGILLEEPQC